MSDEVKSMNNALAQLFNKENESLPGSLAKIQYLESWVRAIIRDEMKPKGVTAEMIAHGYVDASYRGRGSQGQS